ncbi:protein-tyrosine-phosphatase [Flavobacterium circumlabens]|uniref:Arsenate reductase n=1 Tax=Flavobacterium circumlabens TaxID=2133765 RepID=A0A4Y7UHE5_9FLAO|nr:protein-tyrosine-phosphatase [Flavobacterium circumlabens]TCN60036.1 arsenate reductase [Flavobacterium circumlabens]TEB45272.1 protein-tyrosine-phosphatase [Flavobacterium circumlabens]
MLYTEIENTISAFDFEQISGERKIILQPLIDFIQRKTDRKLDIRLNLICTHNSRRSHLSQIWAQTAAAHYNIKNVFCYSGGTEATALFPMIAETLTFSGFKVKTLSEGKNPVYAIKFSANELPVIGFSKTYDDDFNPDSEFAAIMTCSQADGGCPFIAGAEIRIPITFEDPKVSDGTPQQKQIYQERSLQIGTEMFYVFSQIKS